MKSCCKYWDPNTIWSRLTGMKVCKMTKDGGQLNGEREGTEWEFIVNFQYRPHSSGEFISINKFIESRMSPVFLQNRNWKFETIKWGLTAHWSSLFWCIKYPLKLYRVARNCQPPYPVHSVGKYTLLFSWEVNFCVSFFTFFIFLGKRFIICLFVYLIGKKYILKGK